MIGEVMKLTAPARDKDSVAKPATEAGTPEEEEDWESYGNGFDAVFVDTFAEGYEGACFIDPGPPAAWLKPWL